MTVKTVWSDNRWIVDATYEYEYKNTSGYDLKSSDEPVAIRFAGSSEVTDFVPRGKELRLDIGRAAGTEAQVGARTLAVSQSAQLLTPSVNFEWEVDRDAGDAGSGATLAAGILVDTNTFIDKNAAWTFDLDVNQMFRTSTVLVARHWEISSYTRKVLFLISGFLADSIPNYVIKFQVGFNHGTTPVVEDTFSVSAFVDVSVSRVNQRFHPELPAVSLRTESPGFLLVEDDSEGDQSDTLVVV